MFHITGEFPNNIQSCFITWKGKRYSSEQFEVLGYFESTWNKITNQVVPSCAVEGGRLNTGEVMYICRVKYSNGFSVGRVLNGTCQVPIYSPPGEQDFNTYEILCV